jgi:LytR cell envelope-related transcriptional attenuator
VLVAFVVVTVLVLGVIHPVTPPTTPVSASASTTTTTPAHPTTTTTTVPPSHVPVLVANASGITGAAGAVTTQLHAAGWDLLPPANASAQVTKSNVYYVAGQQKAAEDIATSLQLPASAVVPYTTSAPVSSIGTAEVLVVVGPDLADRSAATATTTTVS